LLRNCPILSVFQSTFTSIHFRSERLFRFGIRIRHLLKVLDPTGSGSKTRVNTCRYRWGPPYIFCVDFEWAVSNDVRVFRVSLFYITVKEICPIMRTSIGLIINVSGVEAQFLLILTALKSLLAIHKKLTFVIH
jgi:hypothetical protein